jgi:hypothetical protein
MADVLQDVITTMAVVSAVVKDDALPMDTGVGCPAI